MTNLLRNRSALIGLCIAGLLGSSLPVEAQVVAGRRSVGSRRPSTAGPSQQLTNNYQQLAGGNLISGGYGYRQDMATRRGSLTSMDNRVNLSGLNAQRSRGGRGGGGGGADLSQPGLGGQFSLLARPSGYFSGRSMLNTRPYGVSRLLSNIDRATYYGAAPISTGYYQPGSELERATIRYASWAPPEIVARPETAANTSTADDALVPPASPISMRDVMRNRLTAQRDAFIARGWQAFREGQYHQARAQFALADQANLDDLDMQAQLKLASLYANLAASEYVQAGTDLAWLLRGDPITGRAYAPTVWADFQNLRGRYGDPAQLTRQKLLLNNFAAQNRESPETIGLLIALAWGEGDAAGALFQARNLSTSAPADSIWTRLYPMLMEARNTENPATRPAGS